MSSFTCPVVEILEATKHPNADRLTIYKVLGYQAISSNLEDGSPRYKVGDKVVYLPEDSVLPEWLLKQLDFWDETNQKGILSGSRGNRIKIIKLRQEISQGVLYPVVERNGKYYIDVLFENQIIEVLVEPEQDVSELLGIKKYEVTVPQSMMGEIGAFAEWTMKYDFENLQKFTKLFVPEDDVVVTSKLHGTLMQLIYSPKINEEFGFERKLLVTSKGIGARGFIILNNENNQDNLYIKMINKLLKFNPDMIKSLDNFCKEFKIKSVHIFGEIFGRGVQDLSYGTTEPQFRVFDIALNKEFTTYDFMIDMCEELKLQTVPEIYRGKYDIDKFMEMRKGKDLITGTHVTEGIVVKDLNNGYHERYGRKIGKLINPEYLLRKNGTEYN